MISNESDVSAYPTLSREDKFNALYLKYSTAAYGLAVRLTADRASAEDAVQEAMLRIWRSALEFRPQNTRSWILRIVARECIRLANRCKCEAKRAEIANTLSLQARESALCGESEGSNRLLELDNALAALSQPERNLLKLRFVDGLSQRRISGVLAVPQQTISFQLRRAMLNARTKFRLSCLEQQ